MMLSDKAKEFKANLDISHTLSILHFVYLFNDRKSSSSMESLGRGAVELCLAQGNHYTDMNYSYHSFYKCPLRLLPSSTCPQIVTPLGEFTETLQGESQMEEVDHKVWDLGRGIIPGLLLFLFIHVYHEGKKLCHHNLLLQGCSNLPTD